MIVQRSKYMRTRYFVVLGFVFVSLLIDVAGFAWKNATTVFPGASITFQ
jgi:hypothetical protein